LFLKHVELFGFKSFADRTKIEFADGISALLGPNGCGKSNVVDSIKWVLGEQSHKTLRASKMEDVIFNGTENRKALNVAEVTLTLSNDQGILDLDMPEVSIKRRLYRSGESEYFINNTPVRLKELRELFFDTGVGKSAYSIMEQGKIDQILSNKPEERRYIFEEAAGITKYKLKGAEAERKLERTNDNIRQVESILSEVKRSYDSLKVQADKTRKYRKSKDNIFYLELDIQLLRLNTFIKDKEQKEEQLKDITAKRNTLRESINAINTVLESNLDQVNTMEAQLIETQKKLYGIDLEKTNLETQSKFVTEEKEDLSRRLRQLDLRIHDIQEKVKGAEKEILQKEVKDKEYQSRIQEIDKNIIDFNKNIEQSQNQIQANKESIAQGESQIGETELLIEKQEQELRLITDDIVSKLDEALSQSGYSQEQQSQSEEEFYKSLQGLKIKLQGQLDRFWDETRFGTPSGESLSTFIASMGESLKGFGTLEEQFEAYKKTLPDVFHDFLSPQGIIGKKRELDTTLESLKHEISQLRLENKRLNDENTGLTGKITKYRNTLEELKVNQARIAAQANALEEAKKVLLRELEALQAEVKENQLLQQEDQKKFDQLQERLQKMAQEMEAHERSEGELKGQLKTLEKGISDRNKDLLGKEKELSAKNSELAKMQSRIDQLQMGLAQSNTEIKNLYDNFRDRYSRELQDYLPRLEEIDIPTKDLKDRLQQEKNDLRNLGQVNLMAPEEFDEIKERYDFLSNQINDLTIAQEDLKRVTEEIHKESTQMFMKTYREIKKNFHHMFRQLFGGGRAELKLTDDENPLESGIDMLCQPPGKKLESIDLLSGGERSLTAVALLFATYQVKPSPFCILDEIDAALDESNVGRFVNMLMEFGETSQFIVITHNKKTVAGAKTLLGVTMEESGVSKTIAIRLEGKEV